ncbi:MAG: PSD1 and planctomycete cytochrome C domain-containing protein [Kordia sp.]|uniref:PSD1 and planctomycete cytochrome C domain-containing protein n=1 Tax=Kordia sp. TaxID=1965332 RepID=UPI0038585E0F
MNTKKKTNPLVLLCYFLIPFLGILAYKYFNKSKGNTYIAIDNLNAPNANGKSTKVPETIDYIFDVKPILSDRCYLCHGPDDGTREANLRLDTKEGAFSALSEQNNHFAIIPGDTISSKLVARINSKDPIKLMPPSTSNLSLSEYEKKVLTKWVQQGAVWKEHWAFVIPKKSNVPTIENNSLISNEIDNFIIEKLTQKGLTPSEKASKEKLIRRVYFDLTGLPPNLTEIDAFLKDESKNAYEKVVNHLLNSTRYGEHFATNWLDIARYSDTHGYQDDLERTMWPWRDWVISAFNRNIPYDEFVKWQLAGDLLPNATLEQIVATGFNRNHKITQEGGVIDEEYRVEYVLDRTNTVSKSLLGLTMECAQCHDHKYDPISQKEYFGFYAFFNKVNEKGRMDYGEIPKPNIKITQKEIDDVLGFIHMPDSIKEVQLMVMKDDAPTRKTYVLKRGAYDAHGDEVNFTTPKAVLPFTKNYEQNRLGLANWLFDDQNTLTARVAVNRLWQQIFGKGIVALSADFGNQGALPSHPELLDWLAITYREEGWNTKKMIKRMVLSNTYQQTTKTTDQLIEIDPNNKWLARSSRDKLTAEMIRDNALSVSGLLVEKVGGPSVKPYQPTGLWAETTSGQGLTEYIMDSGENLYRRSLYTFWKRTVPPPAMMTFDAATRDYCTVERQKTSTPLQALVMLNDPQLIEAANTLAIQVLKENNLTDEARIETIFRKITSRTPDATEIENLLKFLKETESNYDSTKKIKITNDIAKEKIYAFGVLTSLIFNLDEAIVKG